MILVGDSYGNVAITDVRIEQPVFVSRDNEQYGVQQLQFNRLEPRQFFCRN